ncbi:GyrI-like domain-containing protein [Maribacter sp. Asnod1-A12]|uniref:GyrI-like domain-containing protein n=1 Tax=Maribacter sp. Asnod1-A12 TaxID=3160576 RepID=UPI00386D75EC
MLKHEWRKKEKKIYLPQVKPELITLPKFQFISIKGSGNPNSKFFTEHIKALYSVAYTIKMSLKKMTLLPENYFDWTVYPLEGIWDISDKAKKHFDGQIDKNELVFELMIRQPNFINSILFDQMLDIVKEKKPHNLLEKIQFKQIVEGPCIQMLHIGSFNKENETFQLMEDYTKNKGLKRKSKIHREIYLSDFRKVPEEKLKTVLRFQLDE